MADKPERGQRSAFLSAIFLSLLFGMGYGINAYKKNWFPISVLGELGSDLRWEFFEEKPFFNFDNVVYAEPVATPAPDKVAPGLVMMARSTGSRETAVDVMARDGTVVQSWTVHLNDYWPDGDSFVDYKRPRGGHGMYLHGIDILPDGGFIANFEHLSTIRVDACGGLVWKHANYGHHAVHVSDRNEVWIAAEDITRANPVGYPNHAAPFLFWTVERRTLDGALLQTIPILDVLEQNDLLGLVYIRAQGNDAIAVSEDSLHLNDVETFPADFVSDRFAPGDLLISLREINTILVIDPETLAVKYVHTGSFIRQHDPDFLPNGNISIYDNRNIGSRTGPPYSRIVELDVETGAERIVVSGQGTVPFFSDIMGVHQRLSNGNTLLISPAEGRAFEFDAAGALVWRYSNRLSPTTNGRVYSAQLLPAGMDAAFFAQQRKKCRDGE